MLRRGRIFVAGFLVNLLVISSLVLSTSTPAFACPDEPPKTLLQLYRNSDAIYVARFSGIEKGELLRKEENFEIFGKTRHFDIESTLKGDSKEYFGLEEEEWIYAGPNAEDLPAEPHEEEMDEADEYEVRPGDRILLFLKREKKGSEKMTLADYGDGIKKLSADAMPVYQKRIKELNSIFSSDEPNDERIVDWLVSLAEDPVTRWEGTFELLQAFETLEWREQEEKNAAESGYGEEETTEEEVSETSETQSGEGETGSEEEMPEDEEYEPALDNSVYAKLLDDNQKQRLSNILINASLDQSEKTEKAAVVRGDIELVDLVQRWGDSPVAEALLIRLNSGSESFWDNARIMTTVAKVLADAKLAKLADEYSEVAWGEDDAPVDPDEAPIEPAVKVEGAFSNAPIVADETATAEAKRTAEMPVVVEKEVKTEEPAIKAVPAVEDPAAKAADQPKKAKAKPVTFGQKRDELMSGFMQRARTLLDQKKAMAQNAGN